MRYGLGWMGGECLLMFGDCFVVVIGFFLFFYFYFVFFVCLVVCFFYIGEVKGNCVGVRVLVRLFVIWRCFWSWEFFFFMGVSGLGMVGGGSWVW